MKKTIALIGLLLLGSGCATNQAIVPVASLPQQPVLKPVTPPAQPAPTVVVTTNAAQEQGKPVAVISFPAGATIALNDKIVGVTPGKFSVLRTPNRHGFLPRMTITATPAPGSQGLYVQTRLFDGYTDTPDKIEFDMAKPPPLPSLAGE